MKICLAKETLDLTRGGAERSTAEMADCLTELGHAVTIAATHFKIPSDRICQWQTRQISIPRRLTRAGRFAAFDHQLKHHRTDANYDIVHAIDPVTCADLYQPRGGSIAFTAQRHLQTYPKPLRPLKGALLALNRGRAAKINAEKKLCRHTDTILLALSQYVADQYRQLYDLPSHRLKIIPNGIIPDRFIHPDLQQHGRHLRHLFERDSKLTLFLYIAENFRLKGLTALLHAAADARRHAQSPTSDFRILVISREDYSAYWPLVKRLNLTDHVLFLGVSQHVERFMAMADVLVLPTFHDACSRVVLEALAASLPVITTRFNGAADFLDDSIGILLDQPDNVPALSAALQRCLDPEQLTEFQHCLHTRRAQLLDSVSMRRHARQLTDLYQQCLSR